MNLFQWLLKNVCSLVVMMNMFNFLVAFYVCCGYLCWVRKLYKETKWKMSLLTWKEIWYTSWLVRYLWQLMKMSWWYVYRVMHEKTFFPREGYIKKKNMYSFYDKSLISILHSSSWKFCEHCARKLTSNCFDVQIYNSMDFFGYIYGIYPFYYISQIIKLYYLYFIDYYLRFKWMCFIN